MPKSRRYHPFLEKFGQKFIDPKSVINLKQNNGNSYWLRLLSNTGTIEGKFHFCKKNSKKVIIFEPGFPGDGSTRLENLWLAVLLKQGFDVLAIRHNGTIINGKFSDTYLNCKERQKLAKKTGETVLGDNPPYTIADWLNESLIALEVLFKVYPNIYLIGHSFGGLAILYSLVNFHEKFPKKLRKIKRLISLAGTTGFLRSDDDPVLNMWRQHIDTRTARSRIRIGSAQENIKFLKKAYKKVHQNIAKLSGSLQMIFVYVYGEHLYSLDEFIYPHEPLDILRSLNGQGTLVIDKSERADKTIGQLAHDFNNLKPAILVKLLQQRVANQILVI